MIPKNCQSLVGVGWEEPQEKRNTPILNSHKSWPRVLPGSQNTRKQAQPAHQPLGCQWDTLVSLPVSNLFRLLIPN